MEKPNYKLQDIVDIPALSQMLDMLYNIARIPSAIIDMDGNILTGAGWQRICTDFFRHNPEAEKKCIQSDIHISNEILHGKPYIIYECPHGLIDSCCPITVDGQHVANVFTGQMLHIPLNDEIIERFRSRARQYGFNEKNFLAALSEVPVFPLEKHKLILDFLARFAEQIANMGATNLKTIEQSRRIEESEASLKLAQDVANIGSWMWDIHTDKLSWSQKVYEIFGFDSAKSPVALQDFINCLHPDDEKFVSRSIEEAVKKQKKFDLEYRIIRPVDGKEKFIHLKGQAFYNDKGEADRMLGMVFDITERRQLEEERQKIQKLESIGILAGGIAHDFNNLLAAIRNNIYLAVMHADRETKVYENLKSTENIIHRAANLTRQLLTFSKGGSPVKKTASIVELIGESSEFFLRGSSVRCTYNMADTIWPVDVDEGQINQVIHNLILNAVQSMPKGGTIQISTENSILGSDNGLQLKEGRYVKISIQDQGIGIAEDHLKNIFDPYFTTKDMGRGLGLSITYSIIKNHDGTISVESEKGAGTTFIIYLPASDKHMGEKERTVDAFAAGKGKVLVMDDEEIIRESAGQLLTFNGYEVECAKDGDEAIALYKKAMETMQPFNAVILDLTIRGGMGGKETIKKLQEIDPKIKAIVASGYSNDPLLANYRKHGFCGVFVKHDKPEELGKILHKVISDAS